MAPTPRLATITSLALLALSPLAVSASPTHPTRATETDGFYNPTDGGGKWLTDAIGTYPAGLGEPINGVLSSDSDAYVLTNAGFLDWGVSVGYGGSCLGQMGGNPQAANLGDGNGVVNQTDLLRWDYGDPVLGTCTETVKGGSHYRYWVQNGTAANSGAYFMALSYEKNSEPPAMPFRIKIIFLTSSAMYSFFSAQTISMKSLSSPSASEYSGSPKVRVSAQL
ncbi:hypothetical protein P7C70_g3777, partial [Phenoliferia sp. Uapishka_3]